VADARRCDLVPGTVEFRVYPEPAKTVCLGTV
jgi:hypothetical protein